MSLLVLLSLLTNSYISSKERSKIFAGTLDGTDFHVAIARIKSLILEWDSKIFKYLTLIQNLQDILPVKEYHKLYEIYDVLMNPFITPDIWQRSVEQLLALTNNN